MKTVKRSGQSVWPMVLDAGTGRRLGGGCPCPSWPKSRVSLVWIGGSKGAPVSQRPKGGVLVLSACLWVVVGAGSVGKGGPAVDGDGDPTAGSWMVQGGLALVDDGRSELVRPEGKEAVWRMAGILRKQPDGCACCSMPRWPPKLARMLLLSSLACKLGGQGRGTRSRTMGPGLALWRRGHGRSRHGLAGWEGEERRGPCSVSVLTRPGGRGLGLAQRLSHVGISASAKQTHRSGKEPEEDKERGTTPNIDRHRPENISSLREASRRESGTCHRLCALQSYARVRRLRPRPASDM